MTKTFSEKAPIAKEWLEFLREQYPKGSRIQLREMGADEPFPIKSGSTGTLEEIDDFGSFHVAWDDGRGLGLVVGQDSFTVMPPEPAMMKLYMPLTAELYFPNEYEEIEDRPMQLDGRELRAYKDMTRELTYDLTQKAVQGEHSALEKILCIYDPCIME